VGLEGCPPLRGQWHPTPPVLALLVIPRRPEGSVAPRTTCPSDRRCSRLLSANTLAARFCLEEACPVPHLRPGLLDKGKNCKSSAQVPCQCVYVLRFITERF